MKKVISIVLSIAIVVMAIQSIPASASENSISSTDKYWSENGILEEVDEINGDLYYYYENDIHRKSIIYYRSTAMISYVEYEVGRPFYKKAVFSVDMKFDRMSFVEYARQLMPNSLGIYIVEQLAHMNNASGPLLVSSSERSVILQALYNAGNPQEFTNHNTRSYNISGTYVLLKDSLAYTIVEQSVIPVLAGTAIDVVSALVGLSASSLLAIASFIRTAVGVYELIRDWNFKKYNVTGGWTKRGYVGGTAYYESWLNKYWVAYVGDIGATLTYSNSTCASDYNNDSSIASHTYSAYRAGHAL